jgi:hypothetical protein
MALASLTIAHAGVIDEEWNRLDVQTRACDAKLNNAMAALVMSH